MANEAVKAGQDQSLEVPTEAAAQPAHRQEVQVDSEDLDEHDPEPKSGQGQPDDRQAADDVVGEPSLRDAASAARGTVITTAKTRGHRHQRRGLPDAAHR